MLLALCCFIGCDNSTNSGVNNGNDENVNTGNNENSNNGTTEETTDWWIGTWYFDGNTTATIDNNSVTGTFREIYEIENDKDWFYYIQYENKYVVISSSQESEDGKSTEYTYSFSQQKTPINFGKYSLTEYEVEKGDGVYTHGDNTTSTFYGKITTSSSDIGDYGIRLYLDNLNQKLVSVNYSSKEKNLIYSKLQ